MEKDHTELNISVWDKNGAHQLLAKLCSEHTGGEGMRDSLLATRANETCLKLK